MVVELTNVARIHKWTGELMITQMNPEMDPDSPVFNGHRGELHETVFNFARDECGIPITLGAKVSKYFEDDKEAGIELEDGRKVSCKTCRGRLELISQCR